MNGKKRGSVTLQYGPRKRWLERHLLFLLGSSCALERKIVDLLNLAGRTVEYVPAKLANQNARTKRGINKKFLKILNTF